MATTVKYYYGTTLIGEGTVAPDYPVTTSAIPAGAQVLKREVWVDGVLKGSDTVNVTVQASGGTTYSVTITSPTEGQAFTVGDLINITAEVT